MPLRQPAVLGVKAASATTLMSPLFSAKNTSPLEANSTASWLCQSAEDDVLATRGPRAERRSRSSPGMNSHSVRAKEQRAHASSAYPDVVF